MCTVGIAAVFAVRSSHESHGVEALSSTPVVRSQQQFTIDESSRVVGTIVPEISRHRGLLSWAIVGGNDSQEFEIDRNTGLLRFARTSTPPVVHVAGDQWSVRVQVTSSGVTETIDVVVESSSSTKATSRPLSSLRNVALFAVDEKSDRLMVLRRDKSPQQTKLVGKGFRCVASGDGETFFYIVERASGVSLLRTRIISDENVLTKVICIDDRLRDIRGLETFDGHTFSALCGKGDVTSMLTLQLTANRQLRVVESQDFGRRNGMTVVDIVSAPDGNDVEVVSKNGFEGIAVPDGCRVVGATTW